MAMNSYDVKRAFIQTAVSSGIADIERAPHQTIRRLVDWGREFSNGRFQKGFFGAAGSLLENEVSVYYTLIENLVRRVNHRTLRTFGINVGYNAWTMGAAMIRAREASDGYNIPWLVQFRDFSGYGTLTCDTMSQIIKEGQSVGIYAYGINAQTPQALQQSCALALRFPDRAFWILADAGCFPDRLDSTITGLYNTMFAVRQDFTDSKTLCGKLTDAGCLVALYTVYDSAGDILNGCWRGGLADTQVPFFFFVAGEQADEEARLCVAEYAARERKTQALPVFVVALFDDVLRIDRIISGEPCFLYLTDNGEASSVGEKGIRRGGNLSSLDFLSLLRAVAPRIGYTA